MTTSQRSFFVVSALFFAFSAVAVFFGGEAFLRAAQHPRSMMTIGFFWVILGAYGLLVPRHALVRRVAILITALGVFQLLFARTLTPVRAPSVALSGTLLAVLAAVLILLPLVDKLRGQKSQNSVSAETSFSS